MKKIKVLLQAMILLSAFLAQNARADLVLGADFTRSSFNYAKNSDVSLSDAYNVIGPIVGFSINGVGLEGFYKVSSNTEDNNGISSELKSYGFDFIMALPTNEYIDFVASVGYVKYKFTLDGSKEETDASGARFGLGMQFNFNKTIALRAMYHYTLINDGIKNFDYINELTAGLRFYL